VVKPVYKDVIKKGKNAYDLVSFVQWKVVNARKETLLNLEYDHLQPVMNSLYSYMTAGKYGLLNDTGQPLTAAIYDEINTFVKDLSVVRSGDRYGVITTTGREALPVQYEAVVIDSSGAYIKARQDGQWGVFSKSGKALTALIYDDIRVQPYGLFNVRAGQLWYLLDASGHVFGSSSYEHLGDFSELYAVARSRGRAGVINSRGSWVLEPAYDSIRVIDSRVACFYSDGLVNLFNKQVMVSAEQILPLTRELFRIRSGEKVGIWHNKGYEVIPAKYDFISNPGKDSLLSVYIEEKKGLINLQGKIILKPQSLYQELHVMEEERVGVRINNKYGFVDRDGKLRIANRYDGIGAFSEGMAAIKLRGGWGFVDMREELRVQPIYEEVLPFKNGIAPVKRNGGWGFINRRGEELIKPRYDAVERLTTGRYLVSKDGKKGLVSETGKEVYVPKYDEVNDLCNGYIRLTRNEKAGLSDVNGFDVVGINPPVQNFVYSR
jgi:hypothetical protein